MASGRSNKEMISIRDESAKQKKVQFEEMYDYKSIKDIQRERINREMKL